MFILSLRHAAAPLNENLGKDKPIHFEGSKEDEPAAMKELQSKRVSPAVLSLLQIVEKYTASLDACPTLVNCEVLQYQTVKVSLPIRYWSRSLNTTHHAHDLTLEDFYAVGWAVVFLRLYSEGETFTIFVDHDSLE